MKHENRQRKTSGSGHESGARIRDLRVPAANEQHIKAGAFNAFAKPRDIVGEARSAGANGWNDVLSYSWGPDYGTSA